MYFSFEYEDCVPVLKNNDFTNNLIKKAANKIIGKNNIKILKDPEMISKDFTLYPQKVKKGAMFRLRVANNEELHSSRFDFNDKAILYESSILAQLISELSS